MIRIFPTFSPLLITQSINTISAPINTICSNRAVFQNKGGITATAGITDYASKNDHRNKKIVEKTIRQ
jgi:hypothetical protein